MPKNQISRHTQALSSLAEAARGYIGNARAKRTADAYGRQWDVFVRFAKAHRLAEMPASPETLSMYLAHLARRRLAVASIEQALAAIGEAHKMAGFPSPRGDPVVRETMRGIRRSCGRQQDQRAAILPNQFRAMLAALPDSLRGKRDRALLLVGYLGGFRRSEIAAIRLDDLRWEKDGVSVQLFGTKDDRELRGRTVALPRMNDTALCPVTSLETWIDAAGVRDGFVLRSVDRHGRVGGQLGGRDIARVVKRYAKAAGLEESEVSGHSLRAGFVTSAHLAGVPLETIMGVTGHRSYEVAMRYIRKADQFSDHPARKML